MQKYSHITESYSGICFNVFIVNINALISFGICSNPKLSI